VNSKDSAVEKEWDPLQEIWRMKPLG
jgi:hypothetical protein